MNIDRRAFIQGVMTTSAGLLIPACKSSGDMAATPIGAPSPSGMTPVPIERPAAWDAVAYNTVRGKAGAIPAKYMDQIIAPDGVKNHLGKHLPYVPKFEAPSGMVGVMWGDPNAGYARHPNAPKDDANPDGHWYNWIRVAVAGDADSEVESVFDGWPNTSPDANGKIAPLEGDDPTADGGRNTVYVAQLPNGVTPGTWVRVWAHCLTHGEYVDFVQLS